MARDQTNQMGRYNQEDTNNQRGRENQDALARDETENKGEIKKILSPPGPLPPNHQ